MNDRLALPIAAALSVLMLALWFYVLLFQAVGVEVTNRSGAVIGGLTVCRSSGDCLHRDRLWPHQTWRVPLAAGKDGGGQVNLTVEGAEGQPRSARRATTANNRASFVVGQGGRIELQ